MSEEKRGWCGLYSAVQYTVQLVHDGKRVSLGSDCVLLKIACHCQKTSCKGKILCTFATNILIKRQKKNILILTSTSYQSPRVDLKENFIDNKEEVITAAVMS